MWIFIKNTFFLLHPPSAKYDNGFTAANGQVKAEDFSTCKWACEAHPACGGFDFHHRDRRCYFHRGGGCPHQLTGPRPSLGSKTQENPFILRN